MPILKKCLLILWCAVSLAWVIYSATLCKVPDAVQTYRTYYSLTNDIQNKEATSYEKRQYLSYDSYLEEAGANFGMWLAIGFGGPGLILAGGTWLLRKKQKPPPPRAKRR